LSSSALAFNDDRLAAVHRYEILDHPTDGAFDDVARMAALIFETPIATVSIVDHDRVWFAATHGLDGVAQIGAEPGLCASAILGDDPYIVGDAAVDPRTLDHPLVRGELGLRFYTAAPIVTSDGHRLGTVNVIDKQPREVTATQIALLTHLASVVATQLELRLAALHAVRAERGLRADAEKRAAEFAARAAAVRDAGGSTREAGRPERCELGGVDQPCPEPAELKLADPWGDSAWACTDHAEDALLNARGVFLADHSQGVLAAFANRSTGP
jgi:GAF domain-containing protein